MAHHTPRQMGGKCSIRGLQNRVYCNTTYKKQYLCHTSTLQQRSERSFDHGGRVPALKESNIQNLSSIPGRLLVNFLPGSQEDGRLETNPEFETTQQVHKAKEVQNGLPVSGPEGSHSGSMGHFNRPEGCLPPYSDHQRSSQMASFPHQRSGLCLPISSFRPINGPTSFYSSGEVSRRLSASTGSPDPSVSRRLAHNINIRRSSSSSDRVSAQDSLQVGVRGECEEIAYPTNSDPGLPGSQVRSCPRESLPITRKSGEFNSLREVIHTNRVSPSGSVVTTARANGKHGRPHSSMQTADEAYSITPLISLSTKGSPPGETSPHVRHSSSRTTVVGEGGQYCGWNDISNPPSPPCVDNRRIPDGMGGSFGVPQGEGTVDQRPGAPSYQHVGAPGSVFFH